jgi:hypothetical protein
MRRGSRRRREWPPVVGGERGEEGEKKEIERREESDGVVMQALSPRGSHISKTAGWPKVDGFKSLMAKGSWF